MKKVVLLPLLLLCIFPISVQAQNDLNKSKKELTENEGVNYRSPSQSNSDDDGEDNIFTELAVEAFVYTVGVTLFGIYDVEDHLHNDLTKYPYHDAEAGNYYNPKFGEESVYVFRFDVKDKFIYKSNDLFGNHLEAKIRPANFIALQADYYQLYEFQKVAGTSSNLSLFYFTIACDRIRLERFNLGWTLGASYIGSGINTAGFSYGLNAEFFLKKNISFLAGAKWSAINGEPVNAFEGEARFHKKSHFLSLGFERLKIATPNYNFITLGAGIYF